MTGHTHHMIQVHVAKKKKTFSAIYIERLQILLVVGPVTLYVVGVVKCLIHYSIFVPHELSIGN